MSDHYRRRFLKAMGGFGLAASLAGCEEVADEYEDDETPYTTIETAAPPDTVTPLPTVTEEPDDGTETPSPCDFDTVEPTVDSGSFSLWHSRRSGASALLKGSKALFEQYGPQVQISDYSSGNFLNKLRTAIPSGGGPHQFMWAHDLAGEFEMSGLVVDQSDQVRVDPCVYTETAWNAAHYNGKLVGLPWAGESPALIYNADVLDEMGVQPPETIDEMVSIMDDYQNKSQGRYGLSHPVNTYFVSWALQAFGGEIYSYDAETDSHNLGHGSGGLAEGLRLITETLKPYMPGDPAYGAQVTAFYDGKGAFMVNGPWTLPNLQDASFDFGVKPIPAPEGGQPRPFMGVKLIYFARKMQEGVQRAKVPREFAEWYTTNDERMLNLALNAGFVPVKANLAGHPGLPAATQGFARQLENGYPMPQHPNMNSVWGPTQNALLDAFNNDEDPGPLLEDARTKIRNEWADY